MTNFRDVCAQSVFASVTVRGQIYPGLTPDPAYDTNRISFSFACLRDCGKHHACGEIAHFEARWLECDTVRPYHVAILKPGARPASGQDYIAESSIIDTYSNTVPTQNLTRNGYRVPGSGQSKDRYRC